MPPQPQYRVKPRYLHRPNAQMPGSVGSRPKRRSPTLIVWRSTRGVPLACSRSAVAGAAVKGPLLASDVRAVPMDYVASGSLQGGCAVRIGAPHIRTRVSGGGHRPRTRRELGQLSLFMVGKGEGWTRLEEAGIGWRRVGRQGNQSQNIVGGSTRASWPGATATAATPTATTTTNACVGTSQLKLKGGRT